MIQFGLMYVAYIFAYQYLKAYQVALFTILTPIYITLINDIIEYRFHSRYLIAAILAIIGAGVVVLSESSWIELGIGFILMQVSNLAFAFGQVYYRKVMNQLSNISDASIFAFLYVGAVILTGLFSLFTTDYSNLILSQNQILTLFYLGILASGICFFLWNFGARKTNAGTLAVFNNLKIPLAIFVSLIFFNESTNLIRLIIGGIIIIIAMLITNDKKMKILKKMPSR
jgi:drug/metabolite transporter (DMT)-like permease